MEIFSIFAGLLSAASTGLAKIYASNAAMWKDLWISEKADRQRLEDKLDDFYEEGRTLAASRDAENTALRREVEELRGVISTGVSPKHEPPKQD